MHRHAKLYLPSKPYCLRGTLQRVFVQSSAFFSLTFGSFKRVFLDFLSTILGHFESFLSDFSLSPHYRDKDFLFWISFCEICMQGGVLKLWCLQISDVLSRFSMIGLLFVVVYICKYLLCMLFTWTILLYI